MNIPALFRFSLAALLVAAAMELAFRLVIFPGWRDLNPEMFVRHPVFETYTKPNLDVRRLKPGNWDVRVHTNAWGMRGREADRPNELARLWIVGDSNAFGGYLADNEVFAARLGAANLASEGHDLSRQARVLRWLAEQGQRPRAVVAAISMYHGIRPYQDLRGELARPMPVAGEAKAMGSAVDSLTGGLRGLANAVPYSAMAVRSFLGANSAIYNWLRTGIMAIPALRQKTLEWGLRTDLDMVYPFSTDLLRPMTEGNPALADIRATADFAADLATLVRRDLGVPFGVVLLPGHHQIYPAAFAKWHAAQGPGEDLDSLRPLQTLAAELQARGVPVTDAVAPLRASDRRVTFPDDGHLNATGHAIVADHLRAWVPPALGVKP